LLKLLILSQRERIVRFALSTQLRVRERERERESISSGGLWNIYRDPPSISSAGVKKFSLVGMLLNATMQAQQIKSAKHKENYK